MIQEETMQWKSLGLAIMCAIALGLPAWAHHSHNNYAISDFTLIEGTVKQVHLVVPHSWVYIEVKDAKTGEPAMWALEATGPQGLLNNGIKREDVRVGDLIKVRCHRLRDGSNGCLLGFITPMHGDMARGHGVEKEWD
jgi:hypothetical protein